MPKLVGIPYFTQTGDGATKAGKDLGVNVIYTGPTKADAAEQVKMLEDLITRKVDAICIAPNDASAVIPVLQKAKKLAFLYWTGIHQLTTLLSMLLFIRLMIRNSVSI